MAEARRIANRIYRLFKLPRPHVGDTRLKVVRGEISSALQAARQARDNEWIRTLGTDPDSLIDEMRGPQFGVAIVADARQAGREEGESEVIDWLGNNGGLEGAKAGHAIAVYFRMRRRREEGGS